MKASIKYFGMIAEKIGKTDESIQIEENQRTNLRSYFEQKHPFLAEMNYQIVVNQTLSNSIDNGIENAEIALLPPFAGG
jgi:sulfur-carrier protein